MLKVKKKVRSKKDGIKKIVESEKKELKKDGIKNRC